MQARDGVFLEDLCPKVRARQWRRELHQLTDHRCLYCGAPSESIDHVFPRSRGGASDDANCVPACLVCNGAKGDQEAFTWYRSQSFYDPRRAMALRAWVEGDRTLARRLLSWAGPDECHRGAEVVPIEQPRRQGRRGRPQEPDHQTRQAATPLWRWQMAS
ncbi:MAG: HNH endonuclease [Cyanobium sp.]